MFFAVYKLVPRNEIQPSDPDPDADSSLFDSFLDFVRSNASVLLLSIVATVAILCAGCPGFPDAAFRCRLHTGTPCPAWP